jgi:sensor histidine kinase regulating citrate/malate metabolism
MYLGIRLKLSLLTCLLVTAVIIVSSTIVMEIMDASLLGELVKRGLSLSRGAANAAGYSMLVRDRLSLDNLVAKIKERQDDITHVAVVDHRGMVAAHSELLKSGSRFIPGSGVVIHNDSDGATAMRVNRDGEVSYEFRTPIVFANKEIGQFYLGIDDVGPDQCPVGSTPQGCGSCGVLPFSLNCRHLLHCPHLHEADQAAQ